MHSEALAELISNRQAAKVEEDRAIARRRELDTQIADVLRDPGKTEGTVSVLVGDRKVAVTYGVTRKVDVDALQKNWEHLGAEAQAAFKFKAEVVIAELRKLTGNAAKIAATYIESKPASPSVKVEATSKE